ncbi:MAG TPA: glutamate formimidoyltransferase [Acholeplasmataceae bacterium]|jgi:glutamate formiminotransferase|nr:glutamate formimidoyltransferase [Acholeplasmataceae bacterium]
MKQIIEIVPNFSEGKSKAIMEEVIAPFKGLGGTKLLNLEMDASYNRSVVTVIGEVDSVVKGIVESAEIAVRLIDMREHKGEHPRMGALDVLPIIPIQGISEEECIELSYEIGEAIFKKTGIPIYFYALSRKRPQCENLPDIRKGEFEGLAEKMQDPFWRADYGDVPHQSAGAIAVGCRKPLIAYNIDTDSPSKKKVLRIARRVRFSGGGYRYIQAGAAKLMDRNICQVTMNLTDYTKTALYQAYEAVKMEACRYGIEITASEIVGLVPKDCLLSSLRYYLNKDDDENLDLKLEEIVELVKKYLKFRDFSVEKIIEYYLD